MVDLVDILNQGLRAGGLPYRINDFYEGSDAARVALEIYGQARDELLDLRDWSFSRRTVQLTLLKGPPPAGGYNFAQPWSNLYPAPGFLYEMVYPDDCLDVRSIYAPPGAMPDLDPLPALWRVDNDPTPNIVNGVAAGPPAKVIYCNATDAMMNYRARITDPDTFDTGFISSRVESLGEKFAKAFGAPPQAEQQDTAKAISAAQLASSLRG